MVNILGEKGFEGNAVYEGFNEVMDIPGVHVHLYGKKLTKPFRKMGHVTVTADTLSQAVMLAKEVRQKLRVISEK